jgi:hypothetical protein
VQRLGYRAPMQRSTAASRPKTEGPGRGRRRGGCCGGKGCRKPTGASSHCGTPTR